MHDILRDRLRCPTVVLDVDIRASYGSTTVDVQRYRTVWCLVRDGGVVVEARFFDIEDCAVLALEAVRARLASTGLPAAPSTTTTGHASLTVAIPTNRAERLPIALQSLAKQSDPNFEVLIIDNSPDGRIAATMTGFGDLTLRTCHEPLPGISRAAR